MNKIRAIGLVTILLLSMLTIPIPVSAGTRGMEQYIEIEATVCDAYIWNQNTVYFTARNASSGTISNGSTLQVGQRYSAMGLPAKLEVFRTYLHFDTTQIPTNAVITNGSLCLKVSSATPTYDDDDIIIQKSIVENRPKKPVVTTDYNFTYYSGNGGQRNTTEMVTNTWFNITLNQDGLDWIWYSDDDSTEPPIEDWTYLILRTQREILGIEPSKTFSSGCVAMFYSTTSTPPILNLTYVIPDTEPTVELYLPSNGAGFYNDSIQLVANATDVEGDDMQVKFYGDGDLLYTYNTSGNETIDYNWSTDSGIHTWNCSVNTSEGLMGWGWMDVNASEYCSASCGNYQYMGISNVQINELDRTSPWQYQPYEDYTANGTNFTKGETYQFNITLNATSSYKQGVSIWIDYDGDLSFEAWERTDADTILPGGNYIVHGNITIPQNATSFYSTLMRVRSDYNAFPPVGGACGTDSYGNVEDYSVSLWDDGINNSEETRWFANRYFNDTFDTEDYIDSLSNTAVEDGNVTFELVTSLSYAVDRSADDGYSTSNNGFSSTGTTMYCGGSTTTYDAFALFRDVTIPLGATIEQSYLRAYCRDNGAAKMNFTANNASTPTAPTNRATHEAKVRLDVNMSWDGIAPPTYQWANTPDISTIIQKLQDNHDYSNGDEMLILMDENNTGASYYYYISTWDKVPNGDFASELHINYTDSNKEGNITSVIIAKPSWCYWDRFNADVNDTANSTFTIFNGMPSGMGDESIITGLDGQNNDISNITVDFIFIRGYFNNSNQHMKSWNVSWIPGNITFSNEIPENESNFGWNEDGTTTYIDISFSEFSTTNLSITFDWLNGSSWEQYNFTTITANGTYYAFNANFSNHSVRYDWRVTANSTDGKTTYQESYWFETEAIIYGQLDGEPYYNETPANNSFHFFQPDGFWTSISVDYTNFINHTLYEHYDGELDGLGAHIGGKSIFELGQTFTVGNVSTNEDFYISSVAVNFTTYEDNTHYVLFRLYENDVDGLPNILLYNETIFQQNALSIGWFNFTIQDYIKLNASANYSFTLHVDCKAIESARIALDEDDATYLGGGSINKGIFGWIKADEHDFDFRIYGIPAVIVKTVNLTFDWYNNTLGDWEQYAFYPAVVNQTTYAFNSNFSGITNSTHPYTWRVTAVANDSNATHSEWYQFRTYYLPAQEVVRSSMFLAYGLLFSPLLLLFWHRRKKNDELK